MLVDLHCHTAERSDDSAAPALELALAARRAGLDAIAFTDHDAFWPAWELEEIARRSGIVVLPGAEINTEGGHAVVFGLTEYRFGMHRPDYLRSLVNEAGGAMIAAHPYRRALPFGVEQDSVGYSEALERASRDAALLRMCDAAEVVNGRGTLAQNEFSRRLLEREGVRGVASSDAHNVDGLGEAATEFERRIDTVEELVRELKAGRFRAVSRRPGL
ncbi:MAG: PHP-associated domain-containing protein [Chloroflexota bacterium]